MVRHFVAHHPDVVVLDLGAGLDGRMFRVDPPPTVDWYDVDFPPLNRPTSHFPSGELALNLYTAQAIWAIKHAPRQPERWVGGLKLAEESYPVGRHRVRRRPG